MAASDWFTTEQIDGDTGNSSADAGCFPGAERRREAPPRHRSLRLRRLGRRAVTRREEAVKMVIGIIGENCAGKSTLADALRVELGAAIITGKDYLRMAKSESEATALFRRRLTAALTGEHILYIISEKELLALLPDGRHEDSCHRRSGNDQGALQGPDARRASPACRADAGAQARNVRQRAGRSPFRQRRGTDPAVCCAAVRARLDFHT